MYQGFLHSLFLAAMRFKHGKTNGQPPEFQQIFAEEKNSSIEIDNQPRQNNYGTGKIK
jgi:hypothetical protein